MNPDIEHQPQESVLTIDQSGNVEQITALEESAAGYLKPSLSEPCSSLTEVIGQMNTEETSGLVETICDGKKSSLEPSPTPHSCQLEPGLQRLAFFEKLGQQKSSALTEALHKVASEKLHCLTLEQRTNVMNGCLEDLEDEGGNEPEQQTICLTLIKESCDVISSISKDTRLIVATIKISTVIISTVVAGPAGFFGSFFVLWLVK